MSHRRKAFSRTLFTLLAAVLGVLASSAPAVAQVSIVPDRVAGGGTQTFAFRLANERTDTNSTRLELVFPQTPPVAYVKVAPARGWTATVRPRPLDRPIEVGGKTISEVAGSLVLEGGAVAPRQFEQFLVTMGPLPADGRLLFEATQAFANGAVAHWNATTSPAPAITFGTGPAAPAAEAGSAGPVRADGVDAPGEQAAPQGGGGIGGPSFAVLWGAVGLAFVIVAVVGYRARRRASAEAAPHPEAERPESPVGAE
ncbi:DUF1775 domain-containing protein [Amycolatopsis mongoliensis]|uniref:DUF1775 domain-containing protein n=1 Tax=Amycolatopsis mongoliensis TaxID=715475 RepID=A0A9Y2JHR6_9PSEU|nr:DUF1775 domain-containing protein [Amycolatopsis sp. 4-36]WIX98855.1 DUF1775 domain-containing protein [Amycolatopsis sp. 4-36]